MNNRFNSIIKTFSNKPNTLFLIDSLGALVTGLLIVTVLSKHVDVFGMPVKPLHILSILAFTFTIYSICCYFFLAKNWRPYLRFIAFVNLLYCCLTILFIINFYSSITTLGLMYFSGELLIIAGLVTIEFMTASHPAAGK